MKPKSQPEKRTRDKQGKVKAPKTRQQPKRGDVHALPQSQSKPKYKLHDLIDIEQFQTLQDRLNEIYSFPSAIIDNDGNILTATAWQDICTKFHRQNKECEQECIKSDQYILAHLSEANPAVSYRCPHGLVDNATPIIIDRIHYGNFFTGQFFLGKPDLEFFRKQAKKFGFDEKAYLEAVKKVPIWSQQQLDSYLFFIKGLIEVISTSGLKKLKEIEARQKIEETEERASAVLDQMLDGFLVLERKGGQIIDVNKAMCEMLGYTREEMLKMSLADIEVNYSLQDIKRRIQQIVRDGSSRFQSRHRCKDGRIIDVEVSVTYLPSSDLFFGFHRDITEQKKAEQALRDAEAIYRQAIEVAGAVPYYESYYDEGRKVKYDFIGEGIRQITGYEPEEFTAAVWNSLVEETVLIGDLAGYSLDEAIQRVRTGKNPIWKCEYRIRARDGKIHWVFEAAVELRAENGISHGSIGMYQDITERKQAEEKLLEAESELRALVEQVPSVIYTESAESRERLYISPQVETLSGYSPAAWMSRRDFWKDLIHPDDREMVIAEDDRTNVSGEPFRVEYRLVTRDGRLVWVREEAALIRDEKGAPLLWQGIIHDITERKQAEEALQASEERFRTLASSLSDVIYTLDTQQLHTGVFGDWVQKAGLTPEHFLGKTARDLFGAEAAVIHEEANARALSGEPTVYEWSVPAAAGLQYYQTVVSPLRNSDGNIIGIVGVGRDITERKRAEEKLRESEARLQVIFERANDAIHITNANSEILEVNSRMCELMGYSRAELLKMRIPDLQAPERRMTGNVVQTEMKKYGNSLFEGLNIHRDGRLIPIEISVAHIESPQGDLYVSILRDITERKRAEQRLKVQLERLKALHTIDSVINSSFNLRATLEVIVEQIVALLHVDAVSILLLNKQPLSLECVARRGFRSIDVRRIKVSVGNTYPGQAILKRKIVHVPDLSSADEKLVELPYLADERFIAYFGMPLIAKGEPVGVLEVLHRSFLDPEPEWLDFLETLGRQTAIAIDNSQLFENLQRSNAELKLAYDELVARTRSAR